MHTEAEQKGKRVWMPKKKPGTSENPFLTVTEKAKTKEKESSAKGNKDTLMAPGSIQTSKVPAIKKKSETSQDTSSGVISKA